MFLAVKMQLIFWSNEQFWPKVMPDATNRFMQEENLVTGAQSITTVALSRAK